MRLPATIALALAASFAVACDNAGDAPPEATLYFPNGVLLVPSPDGDDAPAPYLLVANSNFDLRYNAGTLQAYDLDALEDAIEDCDGSPCSLDPLSLLEDEVQIGSFSNGLTLTPERDRVLLLTRTDDNLVVIELDAGATGDGVLDCGASNRCPIAQRGPDPDRNDSDLDWPLDPASIVAGPMSHWLPGRDDLGNYALVAHSSGRVSLLVDHATEADAEDRTYRLVSTAANVSGQPTGLTFDDVTGLIHATAITTGGTRAIQRMGVSVPTDDEGEPNLLRATVFNTSALVLDGVTQRSDTRQMAFIEQGFPTPERRALVVTATPNAVLLTRLTEDEIPGTARVERVASVGNGPSRLQLGTLEGQGGSMRVAAVSCFSGRELFVVDLDTMLVRAVVPNLSGPYDIALDAARRRLYVGDFRSSVLRVIDLSPLVEPDSEAPVGVIATVGTPRIIQELQ